MEILLRKWFVQQCERNLLITDDIVKQSQLDLHANLNLNPKSLMQTMNDFKDLKRAMVQDEKICDKKLSSQLKRNQFIKFKEKLTQINPYLNYHQLYNPDETWL